ncbi:MAG: hypothetical protein AAGD10_11460 [Myxococcota bacterium]
MVRPFTTRRVRGGGVLTSAFAQRALHDPEELVAQRGTRVVGLPHRRGGALKRRPSVRGPGNGGGRFKPL